MGSVTSKAGFTNDPFFNRTIYPAENVARVQAFSYTSAGNGSAATAPLGSSLSQYSAFSLNNEGQSNRYVYGVKADGSEDFLGQYLDPFTTVGISVVSQTKIDNPSMFVLEKQDQSGNLIFSNSTISTAGTTYNFTARQGDYINPVCFRSGTRILTESGEVAVEHLAVGDSVVTASGAHRPIVWIGHRTTDCARHPRSKAVWPVRVLANAFGDGLPVRDLWLSPDHAVRVSVLDEVLIPIKHLLNDATIAQVETAEVTYWHVELESHDILVAEGMPAESFLDTGVRHFFENGGAFMGLHPDFSPLSLDDFCLPLVQDGPIVDAVRVRLLARAIAMGWTITDTDGMHVLADGVAIQPEREGSVARFAIPADTVEARLVSRSFVPELVRVGAGDGRRLGLPVRGLSVTDAAGVVRSLPIDHARLADGYSFVQTAEGDAWRWTDGNAEIPAQLWAGATGEVTLCIETAPDRGTLQAWEAPTVAAEANVDLKAAVA